MANIEINDEAIERDDQTPRRTPDHDRGGGSRRHLYNERVARATAYDRYFELAQDWDLEGAEVAHAAEKKHHQE